MLGIQARIVPCTIANNIGMDANLRSQWGQMSSKCNYAEKWHIDTASSFLRHKMLTVWTKTKANEHRLASTHAKASKLTICRKNAIFMLINVQVQYELKNNIVWGQISLYCTTRTFYHGCQIVHQDPLNAKQSSPKKTVLDMWKCMVSMATPNAILVWGCTFKITHISKNTKPGIKLNLRHLSFIHLSHMQSIYFAHSYIFMKILKKCDSRRGSYLKNQ